MTSPQKINILVIDDEAVLTRQSDWKERLQFTNMTHYSSVVESLAGGRPASPAIFLVDISFHRSLTEWEAQKRWGQPGNSELIPYGPLLVIPFLKPGRPAVFVPYSSHWGSEALLANGFVLLSMSLFLTITTGEEWRMERVERAVRAMNERAGRSRRRRSAEKHDPDYLPRMTDSESAIMHGLPRYREMLVNWPTLDIAGLDEAMDAVEALESEVEHLSTESGPIFITLRFGDELPEHIELEGLFADIVQNGPCWTQALLDDLKFEFNEFIQQCVANGRFQETPKPDELEAIRVKLVEEERLHLHHGRESFRAAFNELYTLKHNKTPPAYWAVQCMRLTILRAFLEAWATVRADRNNGNRGVARLQNWRPERGDQREITESVCRLLGLTDENAARAGKKNNTPTLLHLSRLMQIGWWGEDLGIWQKPFCPSASQAKLFDLSSMDNDIELRPADRHFLKDCAIALELGDDLPDWVDG